MPAKRKRCNTGENLNDCEKVTTKVPTKRPLAGMQTNKVEPMPHPAIKLQRITNYSNQIMPPPPVPPSNPSHLIMMPPLHPVAQPYYINLVQPYAFQQQQAAPAYVKKFNDISNFYNTTGPKPTTTPQFAENRSSNYLNQIPSNYYGKINQLLLTSSSGNIQLNPSASFYNNHAQAVSKQQQFQQQPVKIQSSNYTIQQQQQANQHLRLSSHYTLTPASSTSSLADFTNPNSTYIQANQSAMMNSSLNNSIQQPTVNTRSRKYKTIVSKTTTTVDSINRNPSLLNASASTSSSYLNLSFASTSGLNTNNMSVSSVMDTSVGPVKRKRGRPPKNPPPQPPALKQTANISHATLHRSRTIEMTESTGSSHISLIDLYYPSKNFVNNSAIKTSPMPAINWINGDEMWRAMLKNEVKYKHDIGYLRRHPTIKTDMRGILLEWLVQISHAYRLHRETFHLSVEYLDRFLSLCKQEMRVDRLQLIGMTCLFIAAKVEEIYPPKLKDLCSHMEGYSNDNEKVLQEFELFMLKTLNWEISPVTANVWLQVYLQIAAHNQYITACFSTQQDASLTTLNEVNHARMRILTSNDYLVHGNQVQNTQFVLPLNVFKNQPKTTLATANFLPDQEHFYLTSYMKAVSLLDLCSFDMDSLRFSYSVLAASAMFLMLNSSCRVTDIDVEIVMKITQDCTGYLMSELDNCIQWMYSYADVCKEVLTVAKMTTVQRYDNVEKEDSHNIQVLHNNRGLLKYAQEQQRKTPSKFCFNSYFPTPPESHRKVSDLNYPVSVVNSYNL